MIMMLEIVVGSFIIGAFIFGALLILVYLLRWLLYETTGVERKHRAERPLDKEESFGRLDTSSSGSEHPDVGESLGEGSTAAPKPPEPKKPEEKKTLPIVPARPGYNAVDDFIIGDDDDSDSE